MPKKRIRLVIDTNVWISFGPCIKSVDIENGVFDKLKEDIKKHNLDYRKVFPQV